MNNTEQARHPEHNSAPEQDLLLNLNQRHYHYDALGQLTHIQQLKQNQYYAYYALTPQWYYLYEPDSFTPMLLIRQDNEQVINEGEREISVPAQRIGQIIAGKRFITADTDLRLCRFFGLSNGYWLRAQIAYDIELAEDALASELLMAN